MMLRRHRRFIPFKTLALVVVAVLVAAVEAPWAGPAAAEPPGAAPAQGWTTSPYHGVIGGNGEVIPCRCRFGGRLYMLGQEVCMETHVGTVMTRCDLVLNNTSWVPTSTPCRISRAPVPPRAAPEQDREHRTPRQG